MFREEEHALNMEEMSNDGALVDATTQLESTLAAKHMSIRR